jgi:hypothetical protein
MAIKHPILFLMGESYRMTHLLQKRDQKGLIKTIAKSDVSFDPKEVLKEYGPGKYYDKDTSPRFHVIWKSWLGEQPEKDEAPKELSNEIESLKKKTGYLTAAGIILGASEIIVAGVTATNFVNHGLRLNRLESIAATVNAQRLLGFVCPDCLRPLHDLLGSFCGNCGAPIDWSKRSPTREVTGRFCPTVRTQ